MKKLLICEDDQNIRLFIKHILNDYEFEFQIFESDSVKNTIDIIEREYPEILLLDININGGTAFDVLNHFPNIKSKLIFITNIDDKAIKAIKLEAVDYVLKPIVRVELVGALDKAFALLNKKKSELKTNKIIINNATETYILKNNDIVSLQADGSYTKVDLENGNKVISSKPLKYFEKLLFEDDSFLRIHKSYIINLNYLEKIIKVDGGFVKLKNNKLIPISSSKKGILIDRIHR